MTERPARGGVVRPARGGVPGSLLLLLVLSLVPGAASAHGGLPLAETIFFDGETLIVPTKWWGVFFGADGGPWRWICEEAINQRKDRQWARSSDGTYYVTDYAGLTSSRDGGCTWVGSTGDLSLRQTSAVLVDPSNPRVAWATTDQGADQPWNAIFRSGDDGLSWSAVLTGDEYFRGVVATADGARLYAIGAARPHGAVDGGLGDGGAPLPAVALHRSRDAGKTWSAVPLGYTLDGAVIGRIAPIAVDPRDPEVIYLRVDASPLVVLLRATSDGKTSEIMRRSATTNDPQGIGQLGWSEGGDTMYIGTSDGLYRSVAGGAATRISNLSQAQCAVRHGSALYACGWNYAPDGAAIARSDDDGATWRRVFQYGDVCGPTLACAPGTPVGMICPGVWQMYQGGLGASLENCGSDGPDLGANPSPKASGCSSAGGGRGGDGRSMVLVAGAALLMAAFASLRHRRKRAKERSRQGTR